MVLYIDTTQPQQVTVGLTRRQEWYQCRHWRQTNMRAEQLLPVIQQLLNHRNLARSLEQGIVVVTGPASFTAARAGVVVANALQYALQVPAVGIRRRSNTETRDQLLARGTRQLRRSIKSKHIAPVYHALAASTVAA